MKKTRGLGPWMFAALITAAVASPGLGRKDAAGTARAQAESTTAQTSAPGATAGDDDGIDTLDTIADSFAIDTSSGALQRRVFRNVRALRPTAESGDLLPPVTVQQANAVDYLRAFFALGIRGSAELDRARAAVARLDRAYFVGEPPREPRARLASALDDIDQFLARYFDDYPLTDKNARKEDVLLARDFARLDQDPLKVALLKQAVTSRKNHVDFLIATLPDPIDSFTGWQFDPMLEAIAQAIAASDYVLDRFHFPDSDKEAGAAGGTADGGRLHELEPGVVVFRNYVGKDEDLKSAYGDRLVLLLVHENPAAGIHARALANAIKLVAKCKDLARDPKTIRILGPTFSGSSESLNRALRMAEIRMEDTFDVRIVSGSATDSQNKVTIESTPAKGVKLRAFFQATVNPDAVLMPRLVDQLHAADWSKQIGVLFEANTQYGREMGEELWKQRFSGRAPITLIHLPFPMNISRLRTTAETNDAAQAVPLGLPSRFRHLEMEAQGNPTDQIPQFNPKTSATYVELALAGMFETMDRERVKTVALMATDPRDKLFLAQQIARYSPDVSILTAESDSLYIHPDYSSYLRGALVVSTYPLYSGNQRWSYGYQGGSWGRRQFANGSAQGIYNAALALLDYREDGTPIGDDPPRLLEYGPPGEDCSTPCKPPVWISVLGRSSAWPVRAYVVDDPSGYVFGVTAPTDHGRPAVFPSPSFYTVLFVLTSAILVGWTVQGRRAATTSAMPRRPSVRIGETGPEGHAYLLVGLTGALLIQTYIWVLCLLRVQIADQTGSAIVALVASSIGILAACHMTARVLAAIVRRDLDAARRSASWRRTSTWAIAAAAALCGWGVWNFAQYLRTYHRHDQSDAISFLARSLDLGNGVSPTLPVLFLGSAFTLWGLTELARVRRGRVVLADAAVHPLLQELVYADIQKLKAPWSLLNQSLLSVPSGGIAIAAFAFIATCLVAFDPFVSWLVTIEGPQFGRFVSAMVLLVQAMLALALVQFAFLWFRIKQLLGFMARHPLAGTYERVSRDLFPTSIFPKEPKLVDLQIPVAHWQRLVDARGPGSQPLGAVSAESPTLSATFQAEMQAAPDTPWAASRTWTALLNAASFTAAQLRTGSTPGSTTPVRVTPGTQSTPDGSPAYATTAVVSADEATDAVVKREAELPAMLVAFVVRDALARLAQNLIFVISGVVLVFCSYTLFPIQQHTQLQLLGWIYIGITFTTILTVLVQIKRNEIVASLTTTTPGVRTTWDAAFVLRVTVFALLPLFTLFAAQFPDIGGVILRWMEPVQRALP